jgi:hypothetical protein
MMTKQGTAVRSRQNESETTWAHLVGKRGSLCRTGLSAFHKWPLLHRIVRRPGTLKADPVALAICAIDRVGPASVRACASGLEVRVAVPDEAIAAVLRVALAKTAQRRGTDRLIRIVVG